MSAFRQVQRWGSTAPADVAAMRVNLKEGTDLIMSMTIYYGGSESACMFAKCISELLVGRYVSSQCFRLIIIDNNNIIISPTCVYTAPIYFCVLLQRDFNTLLPLWFTLAIHPLCPFQPVLIYSPSYALYVFFIIDCVIKVYLFKHYGLYYYLK